MSSASRDRLLRLVQRPDADLAEAALLCCVEVEPTLDVDVALLRVDALADGLRTRGFRAGGAVEDARALAAYLADEQGFTGNVTTYHDPDNALLTRVLDRKRGLPITLSIVYVAIARRLGVPAYPVELPGHVVTAIASNDRPVVLDPFHGADCSTTPRSRLVSRREPEAAGTITGRCCARHPRPTSFAGC